jgi:transposase
VYKEIDVLLTSGNTDKAENITISYDEKPGIQATGNTVEDLRPEPYRYKSIGRDSEYIRHGTQSLLAGIDLLTGRITASVSDTHKSSDFITFLGMLDEKYDKSKKIRIVLDNHSAHVSKETMIYLGTIPNRFEFIFTPKHGSWLNLVESFFSKLSRVFLRGLRVGSKEELRERLLRYIDQINLEPVVFKWKYKMDEINL